MSTSELSILTLATDYIEIKKWHPEVQIWNLNFSKVASGGSPLFSKWHPEVQFWEWILGSEKNDHKQLAIRKKPTILGFLPWNFNTQLVTPVHSQEKNLAKIGGHLPPKIKVQRESQLYGTNGMYINVLYKYITSVNLFQITLAEQISYRFYFKQIITHAASKIGRFMSMSQGSSC